MNDKSPVQFKKFLEESAQKVGITFTMEDNEKPFDSSLAYDEAKQLYAKLKAGTSGPEMWKVPQVEVERCVLHKGKLVPAKQVYDELEECYSSLKKGFK